MAARNTPNGEEPPHGTVSRYRYRKCRCDDCRHANTVQRRIERTGSSVARPRTSPHGSRHRKYVMGCQCALCKKVTSRNHFNPNVVGEKTEAAQIRRGYKPLKAARHGTRSRYVRGCGCQACKTANRVYQREVMRIRRIQGKA